MLGTTFSCRNHFSDHFISKRFSCLLLLLEIDDLKLTHSRKLSAEQVANNTGNIKSLISIFFLTWHVLFCVRKLIVTRLSFAILRFTHYLLLHLKVCEVFLFGESTIKMQYTLVCMFFFTFLEKRRQHKYCLCEVNLVSSCKYLIWWAKGYICLEKQQFKTLVASSPIFVADTKIIFGYNFVAPPLKNNKVIIKFSFKLGHFFLCVTLCHVILRLKTIKARSMNKIKKKDKHQSCLY